MKWKKAQKNQRKTKKVLKSSDWELNFLATTFFIFCRKYFVEKHKIMQ